MATLPTDPRRRNLAILGGIAALALIAALLAVWHQSSTEESESSQTFFPQLAHAIAQHQAAQIHIESKAGGKFDVVFHPQTGWVIATSGNFPASFEQVNGTLVGLAAMQTVEKKTSRPDLLHYLGLDAPPKGDGTLIVVKTEKGETLASIITGKTSDIGDQTGATGLFVRRPDSDQSWLVRSVSEIRTGLTDWMSKTVMDVDRARVQEADMTPLQGPAYSVHRDKPSVADFTLTPLPAGRELSDPTVANGVADSIVGFSFDDAKPASGFDFGKAGRLVTKTFDGLIVTVSTIKTDSGYWAIVSADIAPGKTSAAKEAGDINTRARGWAYKLADFKGAQFTTPLENLLKPKGTPATTAP
ncbi:MAG TPA: DUF4340 domain-containing protein [Rhizomicrobium sp.]|jgi:hypothetical protein|nr:DUF4340 domain-containing protein [Rhizomicrobium sp.]